MEVDLQNQNELKLSETFPELSQNDFPFQTARSDELTRENRSPDQDLIPETDPDHSEKKLSEERVEIKGNRNSKKKKTENNKCGCCCF